jgi:hypothetical protein
MVGRMLAIRDTYGALSDAARSMARTDMGTSFAVSHAEEVTPATASETVAAAG